MSERDFLLPNLSLENTSFMQEPATKPATKPLKKRMFMSTCFLNVHSCNSKLVLIEFCKYIGVFGTENFPSLVDYMYIIVVIV